LKGRLPVGIYERLLDTELSNLLRNNLELKPILRALDDEAAPYTYSQFVARILHQCLRSVKPDQRSSLINRLVELLSATDGFDYLTRRKLLLDKENLLVEVNRDNRRFARPETPLATSSLLTGQG